MTPEQLKAEKEKDRLKISDLLRQRTALESELNKIKADMFGRNKETTNFKNEIENLKKQLEDQKCKNDTQQKEIEKFKKLYINAKSCTTPFSDSKVDNKTEVTQEMRKTPTDAKLKTPKNVNITKHPEKDTNSLNKGKQDENF